MATLKTIRKRIGSVRNTQKITKAMKMVAAAKLRRAQQGVMAVRPYADRLREIITQVGERSFEPPHPFFSTEIPSSKRGVIYVFTSNRGLCGGFNSNLLRRVETFLKGTQTAYDLFDVHVIGKKGRDFFKAKKREVKKVYLDFADKFGMNDAVSLAEDLLKGFQEGAYHEYFIAYNRFKTALSQEIRIDRIIPFEKPAVQNESGLFKPLVLVDYLFEPKKSELVNGLVPRHLAAELYRAHRESLAAELGARMTAMENATSNAKEMIRLLTLQYNRLRQAVITKELMDIVNGAEAIK